MFIWTDMFNTTKEQLPGWSWRNEEDFLEGHMTWQVGSPYCISTPS